jgi:hypothetical protein
MTEPTKEARAAAYKWLCAGGPEDEVEDDLARAMDAFAAQRVAEDTKVLQDEIDALIHDNERLLENLRTCEEAHDAALKEPRR